MLIEILQGKIHRAVITDCRIDYEGSLTVDLDLIEEIGLVVYQKVQVLDLSNGARLETYLIPGTRGKREVIINGAAARLMHQGDRVIICGFAFLEPCAVATHRPKVVMLDERNQIVERH